MHKFYKKFKTLLLHFKKTFFFYLFYRAIIICVIYSQKSFQKRNRYHLKFCKHNKMFNNLKILKGYKNLNNKKTKCIIRLSYYCEYNILSDVTFFSVEQIWRFYARFLISWNFVCQWYVNGCISCVLYEHEILDGIVLGDYRMIC